MATRYNVASGNWNSTACWATYTGGIPGASAPGVGDTVYFDANSGLCQMVADVEIKDLYITFPSAGKTIAYNGHTLTVSGDSVADLSYSGTGTIVFNGTANITGPTSSNIEIGSSAVVTGIANVWVSLGSITIAPGASVSTLDCICDQLYNAEKVTTWQPTDTTEGAECTGYVGRVVGAGTYGHTVSVTVYGADDIMNNSGMNGLQGNFIIGAGGISGTCWITEGTLIHTGNIGTLKLSDIVKLYSYEAVTSEHITGIIYNLVILSCSTSYTFEFTIMPIETSINIEGNNNLTLTGDSGCHLAKIRNLILNNVII